jgi:hypothetical protein
MVSSGEFAADRMRDCHLTIALQAAVPLNIISIEALPAEDRPRVLAIWRREAAEVIPEKGDFLLYLGTREGETAQAFNRLARGLTQGLGKVPEALSSCDASIWFVVAWSDAMVVRP